MTLGDSVTRSIRMEFSAHTAAAGAVLLGIAPVVSVTFGLREAPALGWSGCSRRLAWELAFT